MGESTTSSTLRVGIRAEDNPDYHELHRFADRNFARRKLRLLISEYLNPSALLSLSPIDDARRGVARYSGSMDMELRFRLYCDLYERVSRFCRYSTVPMCILNYNEYIEATETYSMLSNAGLDEPNAPGDAYPSNHRLLASVSPHAILDVLRSFGNTFYDSDDWRDVVSQELREDGVWYRGKQDSALFAKFATREYCAYRALNIVRFERPDPLRRDFLKGLALSAEGQPFANIYLGKAHTLYDALPHFKGLSRPMVDTLSRFREALASLDANERSLSYVLPSLGFVIGKVRFSEPSSWIKCCTPTLYVSSAVGPNVGNKLSIELQRLGLDDPYYAIVNNSYDGVSPLLSGVCRALSDCFNNISRTGIDGLNSLGRERCHPRWKASVIKVMRDRNGTEVDALNSIFELGLS